MHCPRFIHSLLTTLDLLLATGVACLGKSLAANERWVVFWLLMLGVVHFQVHVHVLVEVIVVFGCRFRRCLVQLAGGTCASGHIEVESRRRTIGEGVVTQQRDGVVIPSAGK